LTDDRFLFGELRDRLFPAVVGDVMDGIGLHHQFLPPEVRPLRADMVLVGRAMPVLEVALSQTDDHGDDAEPYGLLFRALDDLKPGEVYVSTGGALNYATWGGLMTTRALRLGAAGAVCDNFHRDTREILTMDFPLFSRGAYAQDQRGRGRVVDFRKAVVFANGCRVAPGDIVFGDIDGVAVIPADAAEEVVRLALAKAEGEKGVRRMIEAGETTEAIFTKTGIM
jgi:regulator of RNase E activity RraA